MKIHINEIPPNGLEVNQNYDLGSMGLETKEIHLNGPLNFSGQIYKQKNNLFVDGQILANVKFTCSRCLGNFQKEIAKKSKFDYFIRGKNEIDITNDICQEIVLDYPIKPLCQENCKGLCMLCGGNLNDQECGC